MIAPRPDALFRAALGAMMYFPSREVVQTPAALGLEFRELAIDTEDGERLHGWWIAGREPKLGHVVFCHGNAGNIGDRLLEADTLSRAGFDVTLFDYRGYGHSTGRPSERGTYLDARAALAATRAQPETSRSRLIYLGESLGGAIALELALAEPPAGLILQSTFTSVRDIARHHYPIVPRALVPDAYPSIRRIGNLRAPLLVLHGERDDVVPVAHGQKLFDGAPEPKQIRLFPNCGHNDLVARARDVYAAAIAEWASGSL